MRLFLGLGLVSLSSAISCGGVKEKDCGGSECIWDKKISDCTNVIRESGAMTRGMPPTTDPMHDIPWVALSNDKSMTTGSDENMMTTTSEMMTTTSTTASYGVCDLRNDMEVRLGYSRKDKPCAGKVCEATIVMGSAAKKLHASTCARDPEPEKVYSPIYSASKFMSAVLAMKIVESKKLTLDEPVSTYLTWWTADATDRRSKVTLRHLLSMTAGLADMGTEMSTRSCIISGSSESQEACSKDIYENSFVSGVADAFRYGESSWGLTVHLCEVVMGKQWSLLFKEHITDPLGIDAGECFWPPFQKVIDGGANLNCNARSYAAVLNSYFQNELLSKESTTEMEAPQAGRILGADKVDKLHNYWNNYGLGLWRYCLTEDDCMAHSAGMGGWVPFILRKSGRWGVLARENLATGMGATLSTTELITWFIAGKLDTVNLDTAECMEACDVDTTPSPSTINPGCSADLQAVCLGGEGTCQPCMPCAGLGKVGQCADCFEDITEVPGTDSCVSLCSTEGSSFGSKCWDSPAPESATSDLCAPCFGGEGTCGSCQACNDDAPGFMASAALTEVCKPCSQEQPTGESCMDCKACWNAAAAPAPASAPADPCAVCNGGKGTCGPCKDCAAPDFLTENAEFCTPCTEANADGESCMACKVCWDADPAMEMVMGPTCPEAMAGPCKAGALCFSASGCNESTGEFKEAACAPAASCKSCFPNSKCGNYRAPTPAPTASQFAVPTKKPTKFPTLAAGVSTGDYEAINNAQPVATAKILGETLPPTTAPTMKQTRAGDTYKKKQETVKTMAFPLTLPMSAEEANNAVVLNSIEQGTADSLQIPAATVKATVNAKRRTIRHRNLVDSESTLTITIEEPKDSTLSEIKTSLDTVAKNGRLVANIQSAALKSGVLSEGLKSMKRDVDIPEDAVKFGTITKTTNVVVTAETVFDTDTAICRVSKTMLQSEASVSTWFDGECADDVYSAKCVEAQFNVYSCGCKGVPGKDGLPGLVIKKMTQKWTQLISEPAFRFSKYARCPVVRNADGTVAHAPTVPPTTCSGCAPPIEEGDSSDKVVVLYAVLGVVGAGIVGGCFYGYHKLQQKKKAQSNYGSAIGHGAIEGELVTATIVNK